MSYNRILVIKLKHIGDVLLTTPVLTALKETWPGARITVLVPRGTEAMLTDHPAVTAILTVDRERGSWRETAYLLWTLRRRRFEVVLELSGGDRGAFYAWLTGAPVRLGFEHPRRAGWQRRWAFTRLLPAPPARWHTVEQNLALVRALGVEPREPRLEFFWDAAADGRVRDLMARHGLQDKHFAVVHPAARWLFKTWTVAGYARVIEALERKWGLAVTLTSGPDPRELRLIADILAQTATQPVNLAGGLSLKELGALIARARLFLGVDSAPMHLAAAVGTPTVAIFGPTGEYNWRPWGPGHAVITKDLDCRPCGRDGCEGSKISRCLTELSAADVLAGVEEVLGTECGGRPGSTAPCPPPHPHPTL